MSDSRCSHHLNCFQFGFYRDRPNRFDSRRPLPGTPDIFRDWRRRQQEEDGRERKRKKEANMFESERTDESTGKEEGDERRMKL